MNEYISDVELAGKGVDLCMLWSFCDTYSIRHASLFSILAFMPLKAPEFDDIKFLFNYCRVRIND